MITPSFNLTATERVLPKLALDFTTANLDPRVTFTRALNTATCVNSSGYIQLVNADLPRFDYNSLTGVCKGLLIEESRTNICQYSEDFSNAFWVKTGLLPFGSGSTVDAAVSPDNTQTADLITEDSSNGAHSIAMNLSSNFTSGTYYCHSYFVKTPATNGRTKGQLNLRSNWFGTSTVNFDLVAKTATVGAGSTATTAGGIEELKNGWFRVWHSAQATATGTSPSDAFVYIQETAGTNSYQGDGVSGMYIWGGQMEVGAFPTSYIPNLSNSTTTRNADVATMTGTNFSDWYNASEGTFTAEFDIIGFASANYVLSTAIGATINSSINYYATSSNNRFFYRVYDNSATLVGSTTYSYPGILQTNIIYKACFNYKTDNYVTAVNGNSILSDLSGAYSGVSDNIKIGLRYDSYIPFSLNGHMRKILYYPQCLINAEVQAFSK